MKNKKPSIGVIIQARMTSTRFPGKSMVLIDKKPVIQHVIEKCREIRPKNEVIIAVPDTDDSEPMLELANEMQVPNFCGDEFNVLNRYYEAAKFFRFDIVVRITGDCPFINPRVSSEVLQLLLWRKLDYCSNVHPVRTYPKGLDTEAFTFDCLEAAHTMAITDYDKEHVTPWMQREPELKTAVVQQQIDCSTENWCVDYPEDIARLEKLLLEQKFMIRKSTNGIKKPA